MQTQRVTIPRGALQSKPIVTDWLVPPFVFEDERGPTLAVAWRTGSILEPILPAAHWFRYLMLTHSIDSGSSNFPARRMFFHKLEGELKDLEAAPVLIMSVARCDGHQGFICLRLVIDASRLWAGMLGFAHLMRAEHHRSRVLKCIMAYLEKKVRVRDGHPPPQCRRFLYALFENTLLRTAVQGKQFARSEKRRSFVTRIWREFNSFSDVFNGYVTPDGFVVIYKKTRSISRAGFVLLAFEACRTLFFPELPRDPRREPVDVRAALLGVGVVIPLRLRHWPRDTARGVFQRQVCGR